MYIARLTAVLCALFSGALVADEGKVRETYNLVVANAKAGSPAYQTVGTLLPSSFSAADYEELARLLLLDGLDGPQLDDAGVTYKWSAIHAALYKLATVPHGGS